jgi:hypothetical protein
MPPDYGMPYGAAPSSCFPLTEICVYLLFIICLWHSLSHNSKHLGFMLGGIVFGLLLEFVDVYFLKGYTYGRFMVMIGKQPDDIPLWIGVGWGIIMYSSRIFTDQMGLPIFAAAAFDAFLALNIDLTMDVTACRLHMWDWGWSATHDNPLTSQWFGIPWNNYFGWLVVIFTYSAFSRLFSKWKIRIFIPLASIVLSEIILFSLFNNIKPWAHDHLGINSLHWLIALLILLIGLILFAWKKRKSKPLTTISFPVWLVPLWFHIYFTIWFFISGFYHENKWMTFFALANLLVSVVIHKPGIAGYKAIKKSKSFI